MKKKILVLGILIGLGLMIWFWNSSTSPVDSPPSAQAAIATDGTSISHSLSEHSRQPTQQTVPTAQRMLVPVLDSILASKNDNDPRLDSEFRNLTPAEKKALQDKYREMPPEDRNGRGTIVFLLGRELKDSGDFDFFAEVMHEAPCLSLSDCSRDDVSVGQEQDGHAELGTETTLAYPQIMALNWIERYLRANKGQKLGPEIQDSIGKIISSARASRHSVITKKAASIEIHR